MQVTNDQLYLAIGIPMLFNAGLFALVMAFLRTKFRVINRHFDGIDRRFDAMQLKLDDIRVAR